MTRADAHSLLRLVGRPRERDPIGRRARHRWGCVAKLLADRLRHGKAVTEQDNQFGMRSGEARATPPPLGLRLERHCNGKVCRRNTCEDTRLHLQPDPAARLRGTKMNDIAAGAAVTKMTLYQHSDSKDPLLAVMLEMQHELAMAAFVGMIDRSKRDPKRLVETLFADLAAWSAVKEWGVGFHQACRRTRGPAGPSGPTDGPAV